MAPRREGWREATLRHLHSTPLLAATRLAWLSGWRLLLLLGALLARRMLLHHLLPNAWAHARVVAHA